MHYRFEDFEVDADGRELRRRSTGARIDVPPKVLAVLCALVDAAPNVVTRAELIASVWRGHMVSPSAINTVIKSLRRALDDERQCLVRTAHGIGYAISAPVTRGGPAGARSSLAEARHQLFVGRAPEVARLTASFLEPSRPDPARLFWVHGVGGAGKTTLLHRVESLAHEHRIPVLTISCSHLRPSPEAFVDAIATRGGMHPGARLDSSLAAIEGGMLMLDGYEALRGLDDWLRERFLKRLPPNARLVIAGRTPPSARWRADACWTNAVELPLGDLSPSEAEALLARRGVGGAKRATIVRFAGGHPLTLVLAAEAHRAAPCARAPREREALSASLVESLFRDAPSVSHREALECLAVAEALDEGLLAEMLSDPTRAASSFEWLSTLGMVERHPRGLILHELAKTTLIANLAWRNSRRLGELFEHVCTRLFDQLEAASHEHERRRTFASIYHAISAHPLFAPLLTPLFGTGAPTARELETIISYVAEREGAESERALRFWLARDPDCARALRDADGAMLGFTVLIQVTPDDATARALDPMVGQLDAGLPRRGTYSVARWFADFSAHQDITPVSFQCRMVEAERDLCALDPTLEFHVLLLSSPEIWEEATRISRFYGGQMVVTGGGRRVTAYTIDMRERSPLEWSRAMVLELVRMLRAGECDGHATSWAEGRPRELPGAQNASTGQSGGSRTTASILAAAPGSAAARPSDAASSTESPP